MRGWSWIRPRGAHRPPSTPRWGAPGRGARAGSQSRRIASRPPARVSRTAKKPPLHNLVAPSGAHHVAEIREIAAGDKNKDQSDALRAVMKVDSTSPSSAALPTPQEGFPPLGAALHPTAWQTAPQQSSAANKSCAGRSMPCKGRMCVFLCRVPCAVVTCALVPTQIASEHQKRKKEVDLANKEAMAMTAAMTSSLKSFAGTPDTSVLSATESVVTKTSPEPRQTGWRPATRSSRFTTTTSQR